MELYVIASCLGALAVVVAMAIKLRRRPAGRNPFAADARRAPAAHVADARRRDAVLKRGFTAAQVQEMTTSGPPDVVVIGSGISGLTTAALLARAGKRVLVLEQHDQAGGCCHTFYEKGYEFDTGIHYIGEMRNNTIVRFMLQQLTAGQLQWTNMDDAYDIVLLGEPSAPGGVERYPIVSGSRERFVDNLVEQFPQERAAIDKFMDLIAEFRRSVPGGMTAKLLNPFSLWLLQKLGLVNRFAPYFKICSRSLQEVLDELTTNDKLKAVLSYCYGDHGTAPEEASFGMHAMLISHFMKGVAYPQGGPSEIPFHIIPEIEKHGGRVLVRAKVEQILLSPSGAVSGVRVAKGAVGSAYIDIPCSTVVSTAGLFNTYESLLPEHVRSSRPDVDHLLSKVQHSMACFSLFVGFNKSTEELRLPAASYWAFPGVNLNKDLKDYLAMDAAEASEATPPLLFSSFPSAKDSTWDARFPGKSNMLVIAPATWEWFSQWEDERVMKRSADYQQLKAAFQETLWKRMCALLPQIEDAMDYIDLGTPVTNKHYLGVPEGETYSLDHNVERFDIDTFGRLRPDTSVPGLYMSGQDILTCGFASAMFAGLLTASSMLNRNLFNDMAELRARSPIVQSSFPMKTAAAGGAGMATTNQIPVAMPVGNGKKRD